MENNGSTVKQGTAVRAPEMADASNDGRALSELSLVEIAQELEQVTSLIEAQRVREREARQAYKAVAEEVERNVAQIRARARDLLAEQRRRMSSFDGLIGNGAAGADGRPKAASQSEIKPSGKKLNLADAILMIWAKGGYNEPLTTEEIAGALADVGYSSKASERSLKSTMNQALAKLCRERKLRRYRIDGTEISPNDHKSRARRYMPA
jgi:hypothetical protein